MSVRAVLASAIIFTCLTGLAILAIDGPAAAALQPVAAPNRVIAQPFVGALEHLFGFEISKFATGF